MKNDIAPRFLHKLSALGLGAAALLAPCVASADTLLVLVDLSRSMTAARPNTDGRGPTRFDAAVAIARSRVEAVRSGRVYGLWTFEGTSYQQLVQPADFVGDAEGSKRAVLDALDALRLPPYPSPLDRVLPQRGGTPLAKAVCDGVQMLIDARLVHPVDKPIIELVSDGEETTTPSSHECFGPSASNPSQPERGTWQQKIMSKAQTGRPDLLEVTPPERAYVVVNADVLTEEAEPIKSQKFGSFIQTLTKASGGSSSGFGAASPLPQSGDATGDGCVDEADYDVLLAEFGSSVPRFTSSDLNGDGLVDSDDYLTLVQSFGAGCD